MDGDEILDDQGIQTWGALCMPQSPALLENEEASQPGVPPYRRTWFARAPDRNFRQTPPTSITSLGKA